jgi:hypothetical protein
MGTKHYTNYLDSIRIEKLIYFKFIIEIYINSNRGILELWKIKKTIHTLFSIS